jgi:hypothetical protein
MELYTFGQIAWNEYYRACSVSIASIPPVVTCSGVVHVLFRFFVRCRATMSSTRTLRSAQSRNIHISRAHNGGKESTGSRHYTHFRFSVSQHCPSMVTITCRPPPRKSKYKPRIKSKYMKLLSSFPPPHSPEMSLPNPAYR